MDYEYHFYKVYDETNYYVAVSIDTYPQRILFTQRKSKEYNDMFGNKIATILHIKTIQEKSLARAKFQRDKYVSANKEYLENLTGSTIEKINKEQKVKKIKQVAYNEKLFTKLRNKELNKTDIKNLIDYNEAKKLQRQYEPLFDRMLLTQEDAENYIRKYDNLNPKSIRKADDIYYCDCCKLFCEPNNATRHEYSKQHINNSKHIVEKTPIMVD